MQGMNQDSFLFHIDVQLFQHHLLKNDPGFPASVPTCKELGSHHSHPYKKNTEQTENQWLFLEPSETEVVGWAIISISGETGKYR